MRPPKTQNQMRKFSFELNTFTKFIQNKTNQTDKIKLQDIKSTNLLKHYIEISLPFQLKPKHIGRFVHTEPFGCLHLATTLLTSVQIVSAQIFLGKEMSERLIQTGWLADVKRQFQTVCVWCGYVGARVACYFCTQVGAKQLIDRSGLFWGRVQPRMEQTLIVLIRA